MLRVLLTFVVALSLSGFALAEGKCDGKCGKSKAAAKGEQKSPEDRFKELNASGNGKLTLEEFQAPYKKHIKDEAKLAEALKRVEKHFKEMDTDNDGTVSLEEFKAAWAKHACHKKADKQKQDDK